MQQTEHLKLNLIETGDPISPVPLNENAEKIEAALTAKADAVLEQRVVELEKVHIACVSYIGDGVKNRFIDLGFTPDAVLIYDPNSRSVLLTEGTASWSSCVKLTEGGVLLTEAGYMSYNTNNVAYAFIALGQDE